mgnify:CR=1 FL=1
MVTRGCVVAEESPGGFAAAYRVLSAFEEAGRCLVMQAAIDGRQVVIVLLNSWGKFTRIADAKRIRTWLESMQPVESI